jgi:hypothetical protein
MRNSPAMRICIPRTNGSGVDILLVVALGPILAMCWSCRVSVESRRAKVQSLANLGESVARLQVRTALATVGLAHVD